MGDIMWPDCMMPDGAAPCGGYDRLRAENEALLDNLNEAQSENAQLRDALARSESARRAAVEALRAIAEQSSVFYDGRWKSHTARAALDAARRQEDDK